MSIDHDLLHDYRVGVQEVADCGQYGSTFYIFRYGDKIMSTNNINDGMGKLIETIYARKPGDAEPGKFDERGRSEAPDYGVQYEGTGKL